jgi:hypothetical protein
LNVIFPPQGRALLVSIPVETLLIHITASNFHFVIEQLRGLGYPPAQLKQVVELLHADVLIEQYEHAQRANLAYFYKMVHTCKEIAPTKARMMLEKMPLELLVRRAWASNLNLVWQVLEIMRELELPQGYKERFIVLLGVEWLVQKAEKENLQHLYWILHSFQRVSPMMANKMLEALSPVGLAALCRTKEASIGMVGQFNKVSHKLFRQQFLGQFTPEDMATIFNRSALGAVGSFLKPRYFYFRQSYQLFHARFLKDHLQTESLEEIGKFLARIKQIPEVGDELVDDAISLLADVDIGERVASTDLKQFALLLYNSGAVHKTYLFQLMEPLMHPDIVRVALEKSELSSIQMLIHNVASLDSTPEKRYLQAIQRGLRAVDLRRSIAHADPSAKANFLANVASHIDQELAQEYRLLIESQECTT